MRRSILLLAVLLPVASVSAAPADDPEGDVLHVVVDGDASGAEGDYEPVSGHADVDITHGEDQDTGDTLRLLLQVAGSIRKEGTGEGGSEGIRGAAFVYQFSLDVRGDATEDARVTFDAGGAEVSVDGGDAQAVESTHDGGLLVVTLPWNVLGAQDKPINWTAAAMEWQGELTSMGYHSEQFVDVLGPFPDLRDAFDFERTAQDLDWRIGPGFGALLGVVAVAAAAVATSKR